MRRSQIDRAAGQVVITPHPGLQVGDVIGIADTARGFSGNRRVRGVHWRFTAGGGAAYTQALEVMEV